VNKTAASAAQLAKCILLHTYSRTTTSSQLCENKQNFLFAKDKHEDEHKTIFKHRYLHALAILVTAEEIEL